MRSLWSVGCVLMLTPMLFGQTDRGTITCAVADVSNAVIPGASVTAINTQTGARYEMVSTETSNYTLAQLPAGSGTNAYHGSVLLYSSGVPIHVPTVQTNLNNLLFRPTFANRVPGEPLFLKDLNCHCIDPNKDFVLNPKAWVDPASGQFGVAPAYYNDYRQQRRPRESISLQRDFRLTEGGLQLEVRAEFSNIFNRTTMTAPTSSNAGAAQLFDPVTKNTSSGFGYINPSQTAGDLQPREGLIIAKLRF